MMIFPEASAADLREMQRRLGLSDEETKRLIQHLTVVKKLMHMMVICTCAAHEKYDERERIAAAVYERFMTDHVLVDIMDADSEEASLRIAVIKSRDIAQEELGKR